MGESSNPKAAAMDALRASYEKLVSSSQENVNVERVATIAKARDLIATFETPMESIIWMAWAEVCCPPSSQ